MFAASFDDGKNLRLRSLRDALYAFLQIFHLQQLGAQEVYVVNRAQLVRPGDHADNCSQLHHFGTDGPQSGAHAFAFRRHLNTQTKLIELDDCVLVVRTTFQNSRWSARTLDSISLYCITDVLVSIGVSPKKQSSSFAIEVCVLSLHI